MTTARSRHELNSWKLIWLVFSFSVAEFGWTAVFGQRQSEFGEIPQARRGLDEYRFMSLTCRSLMRILQDGLTFGPTPPSVKTTPPCSCPWHKLQTRK